MAGIEGVVLEKTDGNEIVLHSVPLGETTQPDDESPDMWTMDEAIRPPENLVGLSALSRSSWIRSSCIEAIARNTVGLGHTCEPLPASQTGSEDDKKLGYEIVNTLDELSKRDTRLQARSFADILHAIKTDEEECGQGVMEVSRSRETGEVDGLFHAPGKIVRRLKDRSGWIIGQRPDMVEAATAQRYYNFGEKVRYVDGKPTSKLLSSGKRWETNELIVFRLYSSESRDYGLPRDVELAVEYLAIKNLDEWNASFFGTSGTNPAMLFVQGVEQKDGTKITYRVPQDTIDRIHQAIRSGARKADKVAIIPLPPGAEANLVELATTSERDITFDTFVNRHNKDVLGSFRLGAIFVALEDQGRYTAEVQRALALEQVFDPEQRRYERTLNNTLINEFGYPDWTLKFKRLAVEADAAKRDSADKLAEVGGITRGELREAHGLPPLDESKFQKGINDEIIDARAPKGADGRVVQGTDQRGLRPGIGGRTSHDGRGNGNGPAAPTAETVAKEDHDHGSDMPEYVEKAVSDLATDLAGE